MFRFIEPMLGPVVASVLACAFVPAARLSAYELHEWKWTTKTITYQAPPDLVAYARLATSQWGAFGDIRFVEVAGTPDILFVHTEPSQPARAEASPTLQCTSVQCTSVRITGCEIRAGEHFFAEPDHQRAKLLVHELGHCLGLDHTTNESIMSTEPVGGLTWSADDILGIQALYGPSRHEGWLRVFAPLLVK